MGREEVIKQESSDSNISKLKADMTFSGCFQYLEYTFIQIMENRMVIEKSINIIKTLKNYESKGTADRSWEVEGERRGGGKDREINDLILQSGIITC